MSDYGSLSFDRAQAAYDAMEDPRLAGPDCTCSAWVCPECGERYEEPGTCTSQDCEEPAQLVEADEADLVDSTDTCPAHSHQCASRYCCG